LGNECWEKKTAAAECSSVSVDERGAGTMEPFKGNFVFFRCAFDKKNAAIFFSQQASFSKLLLPIPEFLEDVTLAAVSTYATRERKKIGKIEEG